MLRLVDLLQWKNTRWGALSCKLVNKNHRNSIDISWYIYHKHPLTSINIHKHPLPRYISKINQTFTGCFHRQLDDFMGASPLGFQRKHGEKMAKRCWSKRQTFQFYPMAENHIPKVLKVPFLAVQIMCRLKSVRCLQIPFLTPMRVPLPALNIPLSGYSSIPNQGYFGLMSIAMAITHRSIS